MLAGNAAEKVYTLNASSSKFRVVDGDSVNYGRNKFRLCGIQAPEYNHPLYERTTKMLARLLGRGKISARVMDIDKYKRKVVIMHARGNAVSANEKMVELGSAKHYKRFSQNCAPHLTPAKLAAAEKRAKKARRGIWAK
ncbi:MAG: thermonuclease family protein [Gammaproteobacteria bacterium]